jgi:hypothetical protein
MPTPDYMYDRSEYIRVETPGARPVNSNPRSSQTARTTGVLDDLYNSAQI